jgi:hypothetical protein|tara:strand:- start:930 stop:1688 length:759 start_codon:yes stop_codon:yes gene_type:complete
MISFNNLGHMGRLGNQMFQYAALKGIASYRGYEYSIPSHDMMLKQCFKIPETKSNNNIKSYSFDGIEYNKNYVNDCPDNVDISGYFQSEKYFQHIRSEILKDFTFHDDVYKSCSSYMSGLFGSDRVIGIHVRRTDFMTDPQFFALKIDYYVEALRHFYNKNPVMIVSDDPQWCKQNFTDDRFFISSSNNMFVDLCLLSLCDYHIIANSSFSWWGSWLAGSSKTIAPRRWFSPTGNFKDWSTDDLYNPDWSLI